MNKLDKAIKKIKTNDSIFTINVKPHTITSHNYKTLTTSDRLSDVESSALTSVLEKNIHEFFDFESGKYYIEHHLTKSNTMATVLMSVLFFLTDNLPHKHPKESNIYGFFNYIKIQYVKQEEEIDKDLENALIELFLYIKDDDRNDKERKENGIKICQFLFTKYK